MAIDIANTEFSNGTSPAGTARQLDYWYLAIPLHQDLLQSILDLQMHIAIARRISKIMSVSHA